MYFFLFLTVLNLTLKKRFIRAPTLPTSFWQSDKPNIKYKLQLDLFCSNFFLLHSLSWLLRHFFLLTELRLQNQGFFISKLEMESLSSWFQIEDGLKLELIVHLWQRCYLSPFTNNPIVVVVVSVVLLLVVG